MTGYGFVTRHSAIYGRSLDVNLNLDWGLVMLLFGAVMYFVGRRQKWQDDPVDPRPWERKKNTSRH
jgi:hypothetical protein